MRSDPIDDLAGIALKRLRSFNLTRVTDQHFVNHLASVHIEQGKPVAEMWPCHSERLIAMAREQISQSRSTQ